MKLFGKIILLRKSKLIEITQLEPHVCISLKQNFSKISKGSVPPFAFEFNPENCANLLWFMDRYPLEITDDDRKVLLHGKTAYKHHLGMVDAIISGKHEVKPAELINGHAARQYQLQASELLFLTNGYFLADDLGLGKTLSAVLGLLRPQTIPALIVVQTHMPTQWMEDGIQKFTNRKVHIIKGTKPYTLPSVDVFIISYSKLSGWVDHLAGLIKYVVFDEAQELRIAGSQKYDAAASISHKAKYCLPMSATPIYNYGGEIYNVMNIIKKNALGEREDFYREWCTKKGEHWLVNDGRALGTYMRESGLFLRRTQKEVGRELPITNTIIQTVGYSEAVMEAVHEEAQMLATKILYAHDVLERGRASREFDMITRKATGVAKAREVAAYVSILLESDLPVVLGGWHRDVYEIWLEALAQYNPVMYTGSESTKAKDGAKKDFISGKTNLFILSLRSGVGIDGLQTRCNNIVNGELDWSPGVHEQFRGRVRRDGQDKQVNHHFTVCEAGSDPTMMSVLGLKASQAHTIVNPLEDASKQYTDTSHIKIMAEKYLKRGK